MGARLLSTCSVIVLAGLVSTYTVLLMFFTLITMCVHSLLGQQLIMSKLCRHNFSSYSHMSGQAIVIPLVLDANLVHMRLSLAISTEFKVTRPLIKAMPPRPDCYRHREAKRHIREIYPVFRASVESDARPRAHHRLVLQRGVHRADSVRQLSLYEALVVDEPASYRVLRCTRRSSIGDRTHARLFSQRIERSNLTSRERAVPDVQAGDVTVEVIDIIFLTAA